MTTPLVTFIIPCHRQAQYLPECLQSVTRQTMACWHAVVIDDCSPDGDLIQTAIRAFNDPRITLMRHSCNRGLAAARNTGIRSARTEYFICLDADDRIQPQLLERTVPMALADTTIDCVITDYLCFGAYDKYVQCRVPSRADILQNQHMSGCGALIRKQAWDRVGSYDENIILRNGREDWEFYIRLLHSGCSAVHHPEALYLYRTYPGSMNRRCLRVEHQVRWYIYRKHNTLFDRTARRHMLGSGFDKAALAAIEDGRYLAALFYSVRALAYGISRNRFRRCLRSLMPNSLCRCLKATRKRGGTRSVTLKA